MLLVLVHAVGCFQGTESRHVTNLVIDITLCSLLGAMFPLPRIIYAMASDGLLFKSLAKVHPKFQTPFAGTLLAGAVTGTVYQYLI